MTMNLMQNEDTEYKYKLEYKEREVIGNDKPYQTDRSEKKKTAIRREKLDNYNQREFNNNLVPTN